MRMFKRADGIVMRGTEVPSFDAIRILASIVTYVYVEAAKGYDNDKIPWDATVLFVIKGQRAYVVDFRDREILRRVLNSRPELKGLNVNWFGALEIIGEIPHPDSIIDHDPKPWQLV